MGPNPWSSLTSGGYCVRLEDGKVFGLYGRSGGTIGTGGGP